MTLFVAIILALIVLALVIYAIDLIPLGDIRIKRLIQAIAVILAAVWVASRAGLV